MDNQQQNQNKFLIVLVLALIVASYFIGKLTTQVELMKGMPQTDKINQAQEAAEQEPLGEVVKPDPNIDHIKGNTNAKVALIEYTDFQCPYCEKFHPTAQQALDEYGNELMWVFRHFPLESIHPEARPTAVASECVNKLAGADAFWSFSDEMFANFDQLGEKMREDTIVKMGINLEQYRACLSDPQVEARVQKDLDEGIKSGIRGTPGNVIMNIETGETVSVPGALPLPQLKQAIDQVMSK